MGKTILLLTLGALLGVATANARTVPSHPQTPAGNARAEAVRLCLGGKTMDTCCKKWESICIRKENGKCVKFDYRCVEWGRPPCRRP